MKINEIFSAVNFNDAAKLEWVKQEAEYLLKIMEGDPNFALAERFGQTVSSTFLLRFFRQRERCEKACLTLQYLLSFLRHVPTNSEIRDEPVNPAAQFHSFIDYQADLLLEEDVKNAVFKATNHKNQARAGSVWDFQEQIIVTNRKLKNMLAKEEENVARSISNLCRVLECLSLFWFDVRRHDVRCARRSDIFIFLLAQLVRGRCWQVSIA